jgi:hypothetical protein
MVAGGAYVGVLFAAHKPNFTRSPHAKGKRSRLVVACCLYGDSPKATTAAMISSSKVILQIKLQSQKGPEGLCRSARLAGLERHLM